MLRSYVHTSVTQPQWCTGAPCCQSRISPTHSSGQSAVDGRRRCRKLWLGCWAGALLPATPRPVYLWSTHKYLYENASLTASIDLITFPKDKFYLWIFMWWRNVTVNWDTALHETPVKVSSYYYIHDNCDYIHQCATS